MNWKQQVEYWKSYFRVMQPEKFKYILTTISTISGITLVLIEPNVYISLALLSLLISTVMYFKRK